MDGGIVLIGCGNMGAALASGYCRRVMGGRLLVVEPDRAKARAILPDDGRVSIVSDIAEIGDVEPSLVLLAVKPQAMQAVLPALALLPASHGLVVSIAAGTSAATIQAVLPTARVVRAMPNMPALVGRGMTGLWPSRDVTDEDREHCEAIFAAVGQSHWLDHEADIDAVTALSGSGPAYVFAFVEAMAQAGIGLGLPAGLCQSLARGTLAGAAAMLETPGAEPGTLKAAVRSPNGTTDAALHVFERDDALVSLVQAAIDKAHARARELSHSG